MPTVEDWIVCLSETRSVRAGSVACPLATPGVRTPLLKCMDCRLLAWRRDDRERGNCATDRQGG